VSTDPDVAIEDMCKGLGKLSGLMKQLEALP